VRREVFFEIGGGVAERHTMFLQEGMHVEARFELEQSANLRLAERAGAVAV
jgi:hypothetical protein